MTTAVTRKGGNNEDRYHHEKFPRKENLTRMLTTRNTRILKLCTIKIEMAVLSSLPMKALVLPKRIRNNHKKQVSPGLNRCGDSRIYFRHELD